MEPPRARPEVLALGSSRDTLAALLRAAHSAGAVAHAARDLGEARATFLARGGVDLVVIAPDAALQVADRVARLVWALDPRVEILVFGRELLRSAAHPNVHRIAELHPTSRAGLGAVRRHVMATRRTE